jgi:O-antigen ligase
VLYHVYPQTTWWGKSIEFLGIRYAFVIGVCLMIGTVLNAPKLKFGRRLIHPVEWGILAILATFIISGLTGVRWDDRTIFVLDKMTKVFLFSFMLSHVVTTRDQCWKLTLLFTAMALYLGHEAQIAPRGSFEKGRLNGIGGPDFRESAGLAIHLFALLPFVAVVFRQKAIALKLLAFFAGCYSVNAVLLCRARSAFLAGMLAGAMAIWYSPQRHRRWIVTILVLGMLGGVKLSDDWFWNRMVTIFRSGEERDESARTRFIIWAAAWEMIKDRPFGVGVGQFSREIRKYDPEGLTKRRDAHNSYILCLAEAGIPGLIAYLVTILAAWITLQRLTLRVRQKLSDPDLFELLIFANRLALLVFLFSGLFVSRLYTEGFWWFVLMPVCLSRAAENEIRAEAREEEAVRAQLEDWLGHEGIPSTT